MSLAEQSQQWFPTSVQVTGAPGERFAEQGKEWLQPTAYAIMQVAKDKFSTSVAEKSVAPVWKEEAAFDLPLFHPSNAERCTQVCVMHRALVGPDKMLGQATINLLELQDNKSRNKTEWVILIGILYKQLYIYIYIYIIYIYFYIQQLVLVLVGKIITCILLHFALYFNVFGKTRRPFSCASDFSQLLIRVVFGHFYKDTSVLKDGSKLPYVEIMSWALNVLGLGNGRPKGTGRDLFCSTRDVTYLQKWLGILSFCFQIWFLKDQNHS